MASNYTANYGLCQWEPGDSFMRSEFNGDNARVDAALHALESGKAEAAAVTALAGAVNGKCRLAAGSYTGNGVKAGDSQTVSVGFAAQAVLVEQADGSRSGSGYGARAGLALRGKPLTKGGATLLSLTGSGFTASVRDESQGSLNSSGTEYYYIAFG